MSGKDAEEADNEEGRQEEEIGEQRLFATTSLAACK